MSQEFIASKGWYVSCNPNTSEFTMYLAESREEPSAKFTRIEEDVWTKITSTHIYILDWKLNARVLYLEAKEKGEKVLEIPDELFDYVFVPLEKTREIMNKLTIMSPM